LCIKHSALKATLAVAFSLAQWHGTACRQGVIQLAKVGQTDAPAAIFPL